MPFPDDCLPFYLDQSARTTGVGSAVFRALGLDGATGEIRGVNKGTGDLTEARTSRIYQRDWEDIWRPWESGEPAWFGGRKVENIALDSETLNSWSKTNVTVSEGEDSVTHNGQTISLSKITDDATSGAHIIIKINTYTAMADGHDVTVSCYVKAGTGRYIILGQFTNLTSAVDAFDTQTGTWSETSSFSNHTVEDLGGGNYRISYLNTGNNNDQLIGISDDGTALNNSYSGSGDTMFVGGYQIEVVTGQADQTLSEYVKTAAVAAHKIFGTDRAGVPFASLPYLYGGPAGTNEITFSRDLTDAAWAETGSSVAAFDAVGLEGIANTASTLTDDAGTLEFVDEIITVPNDSNTHTWRVFIDKDVDETRFPEVECRLTGGTQQDRSLDLNTSTGASTSRVDTGTTAIEVNDVGLWWECLISVANNTTGNVSARILIYPALGTTIAVVNNAATGSIIVGNVELHLNKTIEQVRGSTPIFTSGSTVTVDESELSFDDANHDNTEGAYFCEFKNVGLTSQNPGGIIGLGSNGRILYTATQFRAFDGTTVVTGPAVTLAADDTEYKLGNAYGSGNHRINTDGVFGTTVAYDGSYDGTVLKILRSSVFTVPVGVMLLRNLRRYDLPFVKAQAKIDRLMI